MRSRQDLFPREPKIESFLTDLAVHGNVAPATQNQAMNALVFLYKRVLNHPLEKSIVPFAPTERSTFPSSCRAKKSPPFSRLWTEPPN
jgi:hypothetical protein